jgi:methylated-DNA-[protein]-cysteine S-methyltransferase
MVNQIQEKILSLVRKIPKGKVTSYKEIAKKLKLHPRAVAHALALNPYPVKIPCHRVVHADGGIGGYKLGKKRKIELLKKEEIRINKGKISKDYFFCFKK